MEIERLIPTKATNWGWKIQAQHNGAPFTRCYFDVPKRQAIAEFKLELREEKLNHDTQAR